MGKKVWSGIQKTLNGLGRTLICFREEHEW